MARKRRSNPVVVLVCLAITGTVPLAVLWQWAEQRAKPRQVVQVDSDAPPADVAVATPILSVRRAPAVLGRDLNIGAFATDLDRLVDDIDDTSCLAVSVDGQTVVDVNGDVPVVPASNLKIAVAAVALDVLGPGFTFTTRVIGEKDPAGVVDGDIYLVGGGDPVLSTQAWVDSSGQSHPVINQTSLEQLADSLVSAGVVRITGSVLGDGTRYDAEYYVPSWTLEIAAYEAGPLGALLVDDGYVDAAKTTDPALGAAQIFTRLLKERNIQVGGPPATGTAPFGSELGNVQSRSLKDLIAEMLTTSDDNTAELIVKEIALSIAGTGSRVPGLTVIHDRLEAWGIDTDGIVLDDGSGLSSTDRFTCDAMLALLQRGSIDDAIGQGLAVAGVSGTLADEFAGTALVGALRGKTGTLTGVKALSGYLPVEGGGSIEFTMILNGVNVAVTAPEMWRELGTALARYPSGATLAQLEPVVLGRG